MNSTTTSIHNGSQNSTPLKRNNTLSNGVRNVNNDDDDNRPASPSPLPQPGSFYQPQASFLPAKSQQVMKTQQVAGRKREKLYSSAKRRQAPLEAQAVGGTNCVRFTLTDDNMRTPQVIQLDRSVHEDLSDWLEPPPNRFTDSVELPSSLGTQPLSTKPSAPSVKFLSQDARFHMSKSFEDAPGPAYIAHTSLDESLGNSASAIGTPWGSMYSVEKLNRDAAKDRPIQYGNAMSSLGRQPLSKRKTAPSVCIVEGSREQRQKLMLEGKDMMRENQGQESVGPGAFSLHTTLHQVPSVDKRAPEAWFSASVHREKPRLHLVNSTLSKMAGPSTYHPDDSTFGKQRRSGRVTTSGSIFSSTTDVRRFGADVDVGSLSRYANRDMSIPDPSRYLHSISSTSSVKRQPLSTKRSAPSFAFGSSRGQRHHINKDRGSEVEGFAAIVHQQLGDSSFIKPHRKQRRRGKHPRRRKQREKSQMEATREFWASATDSVVLAPQPSIAESPLAPRASLRRGASTFTSGLMEDTWAAGSTGSTLRHSQLSQSRVSTASAAPMPKRRGRTPMSASAGRGIKPLPKSLRTFHAKRWEEWRPTRSANDWGNPLAPSQHPNVKKQTALRRTNTAPVGGLPRGGGAGAGGSATGGGAGSSAPSTVVENEEYPPSHASSILQRSHVVFSADPRRARLRRQEARDRADEEARQRIEAADVKRRQQLANMAVPSPTPHKWNWRHGRTYDTVTADAQAKYDDAQKAVNDDFFTQAAALLAARAEKQKYDFYNTKGKG